MTKEDYFKYYIQGSDHYLIPKDIFDELYNEMSNWREESQRQKKVIDKTTDIINDYLKEDYSIYTENEIEVDLIVKLKNILKEASK